MYLFIVLIIVSSIIMQNLYREAVSSTKRSTIKLVSATCVLYRVNTTCALYRLPFVV